ncbi:MULTISPECIES: hypothetical protein [Sphingomonadaceae]|jgi:hypothetical protein|uniref:hypothetical protein n=1 Tax=Sphingomonadales TaxID=204457 RepID=UPI000A38FAF5|nr:hypothetical protein [Sphingobium sp. GW456-12-10-14-TSB1]OUC53008.1 hypothetical protein CA262_20745 [Sphingobium sp. GW456-12-10-14-TSB1]
MSKLHHVHVYTTIRVKVAVTADDHTDAMRQAEAIVGRGVFPVRLLPHSAAVLDAQPAEEITAYLVDEADDPEFENSCSYGPDYRPEETQDGQH